MKAQRGFTLIELMVAVVVLAILASIAYPSYMDYTQRARLAEARSQLMDARAKLEQFYQDNRTYTGADGAGFPCNATTINQNMKYFAYTCALAANTFTITATGQASQGMGGFAYTVNESTVRTTTGVPTGWTGSGSNCWVMKKDGSC
jgi:type IV pilus assembly protein PilE